MATVRELITKWSFDVDLAAVERFDNRIGKMRKRVDGIGKNIQAVAQQTQAVGARMTLALTAPIVGLGFFALRAAGNFEAGMNKVDALAKITSVSLQQLEDQARELGESTKFSATQAADAMGFMAQAGLDSQQIFNAMPDALNLAAAANIGLAETADLVTNVMAGMGIESDQLGEAVDVLAKTFISSNTDLSQLGQAMKFAGPVAKGFGLDLQETTAILGLMGNAGIQASLAGTSLRGALTKLALPSKEAAKILSKLGVATDDGAGGVRNLVDIMFDLEKAGATTSQIMEVFGLRAGPAMEVLISQGNEGIRDFIKELRNAGGTAEEIAKKQMRGLNGAWISFKSAVEGAAIAVAKSGFLEFVTSAIKGITTLVRRFAKLNPNILRFTVILLGLIATLGPLIFLVGSAVLAFRALAIAAGLANTGLFAIPIAILAIIAAIALLVDDFLTFQRGGKSVFGLLLETFPMLGKAFAFLGDAITGPFKALQLGLEVIFQLLKSIGMFIGQSVGKMVLAFEKLGSVIDSIKLKLKAFADESAKIAKKVGIQAALRATPFGGLISSVSGLAGGGSEQMPARQSVGGAQFNVSAPINVTLPEGSTAETAEVTAKTIADQVTSQLGDILLGAQNENPVLE